LMSAFRGSWPSRRPYGTFTRFILHHKPLLVSAILSEEIVAELARLRDFI
jgi:hypothetical protein